MEARLFVLINLIIVTIVSGSEFSATRNAEIDQLLQKLNKPAIKSIKSPDGNIIDCVHMKNHPIYDHPLFKSHTIQMRPSFHPEEWNNVSSKIEKESSMESQLWTINGRCPKNSIPIIRTRREDILRAKSIERYGKKDFHIHQPQQANRTINHEHAQIIVKGKFHGAKALINVWKPSVQTTKEFSLAQIWVVAGPFSETNSIEVGWQVYSNRYGDSNPHYFIYWTADGYNQTGCYNLACPGFVHVNPDFAIGGPVRDISVLNGQQYHIPITIWKDPHSGNWWLKISTHIIVGYWPASLFNHLQDAASEIQWGGEIIDYRDYSKHTKTEMGSGRFAEEGFKKSSFFRNIEIIDEGNTTLQPVGAYPFMTRKNCYNVDPGIHPVWGTFFYYGGHGRNRKCR
ncbi:hypothetical protein N665_0120s0017 [Sinapis alba]|nr:hypothetical protein N665_0120s0017 [Sinapis alba]